jgi:HK97 gp10 family phage protein
MAATNSVTIQITGVEALKGKFEALGGAVSAKNLRVALRAGGMVVMNDAKARVPVLTGNLRRSIALSDGPGDAEVTIGTDVEYAPYVEFGTSRMAAQPYLRPALDENHEEITRTISDALADLIDGAV